MKQYKIRKQKKITIQTLWCLTVTSLFSQMTVCGLWELLRWIRLLYSSTSY